MKKVKVIFCLIVSTVLLFAMAEMSKAMTISSTGTPSTANSGSEFTITLKLDQPVVSFNAHIAYDPNLVTMLEDNDDPYISINPTYSTGDLSLMYAPTKANTTSDTFKIKVKAVQVTEEKKAEFTVSDLQGVTTANPDGESMEKINFSVTIKPTTELTISESAVSLKKGESKTITATGTGTLTWTSSNEKVATVDQNGKITAVGAGTATITVKDEAGNTKTIAVTVQEVSSTSPNNLSKTGESEILAIGICGVLLLGVIVGIRLKKLNKLFVMLPLLVAVSFGMNTSEAIEIKNGVEITKNDKSWAYAGIIEDTSELGTGKLAIGVTPNAEFVNKSNSENTHILEQSDLTEVLKKYEITNPIYTAKNDTNLATGDIIKNGDDEYTLIIYGDANSDGILCQSAEVTKIINDYIYSDQDHKANSIEKMALDLNLDGELDSFDVAKVVWKYHKLDERLGGTLVSKDPFKVVSSNVAKVLGGKEYPTVQEAIDAIDTNGEVQLLQDVTVYSKMNSENLTEVSAMIEIPKGKEITIDLNGFNITNNINIQKSFISNSGTLTIKDTKEKGIIQQNSNSSTWAGYAVSTTGNLTLNSGITIKSTGIVVAVTGDGESSDTSSIVTINGATLEGIEATPRYPIIRSESYGNVVMNDGTLKSEVSGRQGIQGGTLAKVIIKKGVIDVQSSAFSNINELTLGDDSDNSVSISDPEIKINSETAYAIENVTTLNFFDGHILSNNDADSSVTEHSQINPPDGYEISLFDSEIEEGYKTKIQLLPCMIDGE